MAEQSLAELVVSCDYITSKTTNMQACDGKEEREGCEERDVRRGM